jgi:hypothetical protein
MGFRVIRFNTYQLDIMAFLARLFTAPGLSVKGVRSFFSSTPLEGRGRKNVGPAEGSFVVPRKDTGNVSMQINDGAGASGHRSCSATLKGRTAPTRRGRAHLPTNSSKLE